MNEKYSIILYNNLNGGVDSFLINLIDYSYTTLYCNEDHPGLSQYHGLIKVYKYKTLLSILKNKFGINLGRKLYNILVFSSLGIIQFFESKFVKSQLTGLEKKILIVSGGFPSTHILQYLLIKLSRSHLILYNIHNYTYYNSIKNVFDFWFYIKIKNINVKIITVSLSCSINISNNKYLKRFKKIDYIYNPVDSEIITRIKYQNLNNFSTKNIRICIVANFEPRKGHISLLSIINYLEKNPNYFFKFNLYGVCDGKYYQYIRECLNKRFRNSNIYFHDFVSEKSIIFNNNDICLILSTDYESFGYVAAEALLYEVPVLSTDTGALPEIIGDYGLIFPKNDLIKASECLFDIVRNFNYYKFKACEGKKYVEKSFNASNIRVKYKNEFDI